MNDSEISAAARFLISRLLERAKETIEESRQNEADTFQAGRRMAYYEVMDIVKTEMEVRGLDLESVGLDIDLDKLFFQ